MMVIFKRPKIGAAVLLALTAVLVGCGMGPVGANECTGDGAEFTDDFSGDQLCGWVEYDDLGGAVEIADGVMTISSREEDQFWWTNPGLEFGDTVVTVRARQAGGPDDNAYGIICRYQSPENFYVFLISGDGYYTIGKYQTGSSQVQYLTASSEYEYSDVINQGVAENDIRVGCIGNQLSLTVNGILLAEVTDPTFVRGDIGLGVTTFQPGTAVVEFDDVRVLAP